MTRTIFITLRVLIVVATALGLRWLFLSNPTIIVDAIDIHCQPVGWNYQGEAYSASGFFDIHDYDTLDKLVNSDGSDEGEAKRKRARNKVIEGCNLARDNRRLGMTVVAALGVGAFLAVPKPTQKTLNLDFLKAKRKDNLATVPEEPRPRQK